MGKKNDPKAAAFAAWMKAHGIVRRTARCPICNRIIAVPTTRHFYGGLC